METDSSNLIFALAFTFVFPIVVYLTGMAWNKIVGAPPKGNKIWASVCLLLPIVLLGMLVQVGFDTLRRLWVASPYLLSFLTLAFGMLAPAALIAAIVRLWRTGPDRRG
ncbi:MAG: hypothetical protein WCC22_11070 [Terriglobales bacterium]